MFKVLLIASVLALALAFEGPSEAATNAENARRQAAVNALAPKANGEAETNHVNARRQHGVNKQAAYYGAGVGTAPYYGVPGTDKKGYHSGYYGHGRQAYGNYGYGYNGAHYGAYRGNHAGAFGAHHGAHYGSYNGARYTAYPSFGYGYNTGYTAHRY